jgi:sodium transport system ATP-binding protein
VPNLATESALDSAPILSVRGLRKVFEDPGGGEIVAVDEASLECRRGEIYGLLGPNGAGKTTTLRCLATILTPTDGSATVNGHDLAADAEGVRRSIGFLAAGSGLYGRLTPRETLRFFGSLQGLTDERLEARVERMLALFRISEYADRPNDRLSTGMKQRVSLARSVVHDPPVVMLDEPTTGLDPVVTLEVEEAVRGLAEAGSCVVFSTHVLSQAEDLCDRVGVILAGRIVAEGTVAELCELTGAGNLRGAFFELVQSSGVGGGDDGH